MIEKCVVELLKEKQLIITTAESCTGGLVASRIVNVPGASGVFKEGYITYSDVAKQKLLGVKEETIKTHFAVSAETAYEMAVGGANVAEANVCIAVTGVAGPSMEDGKPVGLVYIACYCEGDVTVKEFNYSGDRASIRNAAAQDALELVAEIVGK